MLDWKIGKKDWLGETSLDAFEVLTNGNGPINEGNEDDSPHVS